MSMRERKKIKKVWGAPLLTVIVRGKPGERILQLCKIGIVPGPNPNATYFDCMIPTTYPYCSGVCSSADGNS